MSYLFDFTKQAKMSRAAKGALIAPAALLAAGPIMSGVGLEENVAELATKFKYPIENTSFKYGPLKLMDILGAVHKPSEPGWEYVDSLIPRKSWLNATEAFVPGILTASGIGAGVGAVGDGVSASARALSKLLKPSKAKPSEAAIKSIVSKLPSQPTTAVPIAAKKNVISKSILNKLRNNPAAAAIPLALLAGGAGYLLGKDSELKEKDNRP